MRDITGEAEHGEHKVLRGFLSGSLWGAVISAIVLAMTSQLADWRDLTPAINASEADADLSQGTSFTDGDRAPAVLSGAEATPQVAGTAPRVAAADEITAPSLDTSPPKAPEAVTAAAPAVAGTEVAEAPVRPADGDAPVGSSVNSADDGLEIVAAQAADAPPSPGEPALAPASSAPNAQASVEAPDAPQAGIAPEALASDTTGTTKRALVETQVVSEDSQDSLPTTPAAPDRVAGAAGDPGQPPAPEAAGEADVTAGAASQPQVVADVSPTTEPSADTTPSASAPAPTPSVETAGAAPSAEPAVADTPGAAPASDVALAPAVAPETSVAPAAEVAPTVETASNDTRAAVAKPVVVNRSGGVSTALPGATVRHILPQADANTETAAVVEEAAPVEIADEAGSETSPVETALERNRVAFDAPDGTGLISIVLVQEDLRPIAVQSGDVDQMPLTIAVPARLAGASDFAQAYRRAGHEVALIPDLPTGATARDVEVALPINLDTVPEAVAIMDLSTEGFQDNRGATESVIALALASGHGLLTWPRGFNNAQKLADQEGVPSASVFRQLTGQSPSAVSRALDQAAFRARQEGRIVMVGKASSDVIEGIRQWSEANQGADTALAPLSAVLMVN